MYKICNGLFQTLFGSLHTLRVWQNTWFLQIDSLCYCFRGKLNCEIIKINSRPVTFKKLLETTALNEQLFVSCLTPVFYKCKWQIVLRKGHCHVLFVFLFFAVLFIYISLFFFFFFTSASFFLSVFYIIQFGIWFSELFVFCMRATCNNQLKF